MGFLDKVSGLFGGQSSSQGASVWDKQSPFLTDMYQRAQDVSQGNQGQNYSQQFQQPSYNAFQNLAQGGQQTNLGGLQQLAQGGQFDQFQNQQNPALQGAISAGLRQVNQNFNEQIMPGINSGAALSNTSGGSRQGIAQGLAARGANDTAADFVNKMQANNFNQIQDRNLQATGAGVQSQNNAYGQLGNFAQLNNQAQQTALQAAPTTSNLGFGSQYGNLQNLSGIVGGPTVLGGGSQQTGGIGSSLQGGAELGALAFMMSDERVKDDIQKVGKLDNGLNVYSYKYKGSETTQIGVMAQEVEKVKPSAVREIDGIKRVNYKEAVKKLQEPVFGI